MVSKVNVALLGAVHLYQIEAPPGLPAWSGSPCSLVAMALLLLTTPDVPEISWADAKLSLVSGGTSVNRALVVETWVLPVTVIGPVVAPDATVACTELEERMLKLVAMPWNLTDSVLSRLM